jgi:hypothetical protein
MNNYIEMMESVGNIVYYPARDTNQDDKVGYSICVQNQIAISDCDEVHIFWDKDSSGSLFDLGMAFALKKNLIIVNREEVIVTEGKSFANMILQWERVIQN